MEAHYSKAFHTALASDMGVIGALTGVLWKLPACRWLSLQGHIIPRRENEWKRETLAIIMV